MDYDSRVDGRDLGEGDEGPHYKKVRVVGVYNGKPVVTLIGRMSAEEENKRFARNVREAEEDIEAIKVRFREERHNRREQANVEEGHRIGAEGTLDENLDRFDADEEALENKRKIRRLFEHMAQHKGCPENTDDAEDGDGYGGDTQNVVVDQDNDLTDEEDRWHYEGFTAHPFWQAVHPPLPGTKVSQMPPIDKQTVPMPRWIYRVTTDWPERSMLALLVYYFQLSRRDGRLRARRRFRGQLWIAKTDKQMAVETGLHPRVVKEYRERLIERGLLVVEHHRFPVASRNGTTMLRVCHYRINWNALEQKYLEGGGTYDYLRDDEVVSKISKDVAAKYTSRDDDDEEKDDEDGEKE